MDALKDRKSGQARTRVTGLTLRLNEVSAMTSNRTILITGVTGNQGGAVAQASQTAWQGIFTHGQLEKGQTILIHGGAGAVGAYAVQLASHAGAIVIATASGDDEAYLNSIGASRVIDYREAQFEKVLREKVDVVFELIGGETQKPSFLDLTACG